MPLMDVIGKSLTIRGYILFEVTGDLVQLKCAEQFVVNGLSSGKLVPVIAKTSSLDQIVECIVIWNQTRRLERSS